MSDQNILFILLFFVFVFLVWSRWRYDLVAFMALMVAVAPPLGQLSNAVLSSRIHDDLKLGGDAFGFVDAAWPAAGMLGAALMSSG